MGCSQMGLRRNSKTLKNKSIFQMRKWSGLSMFVYHLEAGWGKKTNKNRAPWHRPPSSKLCVSYRGKQAFFLHQTTLISLISGKPPLWRSVLAAFRPDEKMLMKPIKGFSLAVSSVTVRLIMSLAGLLVALFTMTPWLGESWWVDELALQVETLRGWKQNEWGEKAFLVKDT